MRVPPIIVNLDLRTTKVEDDPYAWEWPQFPERIADFIDGQVLLAAENAKVITVDIIANVEAFRYRKPWRWNWPRILITLGCVLALVSCAFLIVWARCL